MDKILVLTHEIDHERRAINRQLRALPKDDTLHAMYKWLNCDVVDVASFMAEGREYDVWFDDEYMLKTGAKVPTFLLTVNPDYPTPIMGNILFAKSDDEGAMIGLDREDLHVLSRYMDKNFVELHKFMMELKREMNERYGRTGE